MRAARFALALILPAASAAGRTWSVGGPRADFPFLAPAVAAAEAGDTIVVARGVYREDLVLSRRVALIGVGRPLLIGTGLGTVVDVREPGCEIRGFDIEGSGTGLTNLMDAGIHVAADRTRILGNRLRRVFYGIVVEGATGGEIRDNAVEGLGDLPFGQRGDGLYLYRSPANLLAGNRVRAMKDGIYVQFSPRCRILGNTVESSRYGLHDMFSDGETIEGNVLRGSLVGANIMNCSGVAMAHNRFERNRGAASAGVSFKECDRSTVTANEFLDNARGLQVEGSSLDRFVENSFLFNDVGVVVFSSAEQNVFTRNEFRENLSHVLLVGATASNRWSEEGLGNYWSGYRGFDFDGRGVGAEPHPLVGAFEKIEGNNPAVRLFLRSPAAAALEMAAVGIGTGEATSDPAPLVRPRGALPPPTGRGWMFGAAAAVAFAGVAHRTRRPHA